MNELQEDSNPSPPMDPFSSNSTTFTSVCGNGQVCGILLLMSALVGTLVITICITGVFLARRRRMRNMGLEQVIQANRQNSHISRPGVRMVQIPSDQLKELYISSPKTSSENDTDECPICLDTVRMHVDTWSCFPCGHGCCKPCAGDLLRHSSRRVNRTTVAVLCPLCRKLAVAPIDPEDATTVVEVHEVPDTVEEEEPRTRELDEEIERTRAELANEMTDNGGDNGGDHGGDNGGVEQRLHATVNSEEQQAPGQAENDQVGTLGVQNNASR